MKQQIRRFLVVLTHRCSISVFTIAWILFVWGIQPVWSQSALDTLRQKLIVASQRDSNRVKALQDLAFALIQRAPDSMLVYVEESKALAEEIRFLPGLARAYTLLASYNAINGKMEAAMQYLETSIKISREIGDKAGLGRSYNNLGLFQLRLSNYTVALEYFTESLKYSEELGLKRLMAVTLGNIGDIYRTQRNFPKALEALEKSLKISETNGILDQALDAMLVKGDVLKLQGDTAAAFTLFSTVLNPMSLS